MFCIQKTPKKITDKLTFLGEVPLNDDFEGKKPLGKMHKQQKVIDDFIPDDSALVYQSNRGLVVIAGCSHRGICNILDYAVKVSGESKIDTVIGGLHFKNETPAFIERTATELKKYHINRLHACHCTGEKARRILKETLPQKDIGCSFTADYGR